RWVLWMGTSSYCAQQQHLGQAPFEKNFRHLGSARRPGGRAGSGSAAAAAARPPNFDPLPPWGPFPQPRVNTKVSGGTFTCAREPGRSIRPLLHVAREFDQEPTKFLYVFLALRHDGEGFSVFVELEEALLHKLSKRGGLGWAYHWCPPLDKAPMSA